MAILSKICIIACLLLKFLMCQGQEYSLNEPHPESWQRQEYSLNRPHPEYMMMAKHPRSNDYEDLNPIRDSQMVAAICPAENPNDVRYENYPAVQLNRQKITKDEDDGEDLDMAAGDDDDDDDEANGCNTGVEDTVVDDPAFVARVTCLMASLNQHMKVIVGNVMNIESNLDRLKPKANCGKSNEKNEPQRKMKFFMKSKYFQGKQRQNQASNLKQHINTAMAMQDNYPPGSEIHSQNRDDISSPGYEIHSQIQGEILQPGSEIHSQNREDISPPGYEIHSQYRGDTYQPGSEIHSQFRGDTYQPGSEIHAQNREHISPSESEIHAQNREHISPSESEIHSQYRGIILPPGSEIHEQSRGDICSPGSRIHSQNTDDIPPSESENLAQNREDISPPGSRIHSQIREDASPAGHEIHSQNRGDILSPESEIHESHCGDGSSPISETESPRRSELNIIHPQPEKPNRKSYEEYENKMRRLMANRDAIEKNVVMMLSPRRGERM